MRRSVLIAIDKHQTLTNTYIVVADITKTVDSILASHCIVTFWTCVPATVNIRFILIFYSVAACFRC